MIVRAISGHLNLKVIQPASRPFLHTRPVQHFVALTPLQLFNSIEQLNEADPDTVVIVGASRHFIY